MTRVLALVAARPRPAMHGDAGPAMHGDAGPVLRGMILGAPE
jgi:hypothetical protein